jgi:hypothetical protein
MNEKVCSYLFISCIVLVLLFTGSTAWAILECRTNAELNQSVNDYQQQLRVVRTRLTESEQLVARLEARNSTIRAASKEALAILGGGNNLGSKCDSDRRGHCITR